MPSLGYLEAWARWFDGRPIGNYYLFGLPVFWWARIGKLMEFAAAFTAVLDIVGPERIQAEAGKLGAYGWNEAIERFRKERARVSRLRKWLREIHERLPSMPLGDAATPDTLAAYDTVFQQFTTWRLSIPDPEDSEYRTAERLMGTATWIWNIAVLAIPVAVAALFISLRVPVWVGMASVALGVLALISALIVEPEILVLEIAFAGSLILLYLRSIYAFLIWSLSTPLAKLLDAQRPGHPIRVIAILVFVIGFQFDLLGS